MKPTINNWQPDDDPHQARRIGKTLEELGELTAVLARISIQGLDAIDPATGKTNRVRMLEETADVLAQIECNTHSFAMDTRAMAERKRRKVGQMHEWEALAQPMASEPLSPCKAGRTSRGALVCDSIHCYSCDKNFPPAPDDTPLETGEGDAR